MTYQQDALTSYTIEDTFGTDERGNPKILSIQGRLQNADYQDRRDYIDALQDLIRNQQIL